MPAIDALARVVVRGLIGLFTAIVLLLFQSIFWTPSASLALRTLAAAVAVLTYFRPHLGLVAVVAFTPLGRLLNELLASPARVAEALALACLAGALLRAWRRGRFRDFSAGRLEAGALVFGLIVAASCLEQLWLLQMQSDFPGLFVSRFANYAATQYIGAFRGFRFVFYAMLLLEGVALLILAVRCCDAEKEGSAGLVRMLLIVTVGVSALNLAFFTNELLDTGDLRANFVKFLTRGRFSAHIGDVNAAGSFFAMGIVIAAVLAVKEGARGWRFGAAAAAILPALWLTSSRTAFLAVAAVATVAAIRYLMRRLRNVAAAASIGVAGLVLAGVVALAALPDHFFDSRASRAGNIRLMFLETTWRMLRDYPVFGVGVGQYAAWSGRYSSPKLRAIYPTENAHNNFAQLAGELGLAGLAAFLIVLVISLRPRSSDDAAPLSGPVAIGVLAFLITCLAGHPLLLPEVAYVFWLALAVVAARASATSQAPRKASMFFVAAVAIVLAVSVVPRVYGKMRSIDFSGVVYGLSSGRIAVSHARVLVAVGATEVTVPLRGRGAISEYPLEIDVLLDGERVNTLKIADRTWQSVRVPMPPGTRRGLHRVDLTIRPSPGAATRGMEIGEPVIMPKPNG